MRWIKSMDQELDSQEWRLLINSYIISHSSSHCQTMVSFNSIFLSNIPVYSLCKVLNVTWLSLDYTGQGAAAAQQQYHQQIMQQQQYLMQQQTQSMPLNQQQSLVHGSPMRSTSSGLMPVSGIQSLPPSSSLTVRAIYDYSAADVDEVSFLDGDVIVDCIPIDEGWMTGTVHRTGQRGMLPANYVESCQWRKSCSGDEWWVYCWDEWQVCYRQTFTSIIFVITLFLLVLCSWQITKESSHFCLTFLL